MLSVASVLLAFALMVIVMAAVAFTFMACYSEVSAELHLRATLRAIKRIPPAPPLFPKDSSLEDSVPY